MDITQNYFEVLRLPQEYFLDKALLADNYRQLQRQFHPDKFATSSANEQRLAVQFAAYINSAYQTLKSPVLRGEYLLSLKGEEIDHQSNTVSDGQFLMLQMEWREALGDIGEISDESEAQEQLDQLSGTVSGQRRSLESLFAEAYTSGDYDLSKQLVAKLHFVEKMMKEVEVLEASLFD